MTKEEFAARYKRIGMEYEFSRDLNVLLSVEKRDSVNFWMEKWRLASESLQKAVDTVLRLKEALEGVAARKLDDDDGTFCFCPPEPEDRDRLCLDHSNEHHPFCEQARTALRELPRSRS